MNLKEIEYHVKGFVFLQRFEKVIMILTKLNRLIRSFWKDEQGITGLETAIILIAFVVVATVFAFAILNTGLGATSNAEDAISTAQNETQSTLVPRGDIILVASAGLADVEQIRFKLAPSPGARAISLAEEITLIQYSANDTPPETAQLGDDTPDGPCITATDAHWLTGTGDVVNKSEIVEVEVEFVAGCLLPNSEWKIEVYPGDGAIVSVQGITPIELFVNMLV